MLLKVFDVRRANFKAKVNEFFGGLLVGIAERANRIKITALLITLLQGPVDVGVELIANDLITSMMLEMAASDDDPLQQSVAAELIVLSVSKHERATALIKNGLPVLRKLYNSPDQNVKVRALVGLCKCASAGGDDCRCAVYISIKLCSCFQSTNDGGNSGSQVSFDVQKVPTRYQSILGGGKL